jgi:hypothetical protein
MFSPTSNDIIDPFSHPMEMATTGDGGGWYLREWFETAGLKQFDLVTKLDYQRASAHKLWHGLQPYRRDHVDEISALLNIRPFELLMHPDEAMAARRLRSVIAEVARSEPAAGSPEEEAARTGTGG